MFPASKTYHLGYKRNDETLLPTQYLNTLPASFTRTDRIVVSDPMLATGGTLCAALDEIVDRGADPANIRVVGLVAAPPALSKLSNKFPGMRIYLGMIDEVLSAEGFIVPGVGDAGDRCFGTNDE